MGVLAHVSAMFLAAVIIVTGTEVILHGPSGLLSGIGKSIGGFAIWLVIGAVTAPIGLALRYALGRLPAKPLPVAVAAGTLMGWTLIPVLNPGIHPAVSFATHPMALLVVYTLAGAAGGMLWYVIESTGGNLEAT